MDLYHFCQVDKRPGLKILIVARHIVRGLYRMRFSKHLATQGIS
jgi:hypothetical protein